MSHGPAWEYEPPAPGYMPPRMPLGPPPPLGFRPRGPPPMRPPPGLVTRPPPVNPYVNPLGGFSQPPPTAYQPLQQQPAYTIPTQIPLTNYPPPVVVPAATTEALVQNPFVKIDEKGKKVVEEQLFPPGRTADIQSLLDKCKSEEAFIGLEYLIEIHHNTVKHTPPWYACLLCDSLMKAKEGTLTTIGQARVHLRTNSHKLKYMTKFFPKTKALKIDCNKPVNHADVTLVAEKIAGRFGMMKVKIVVGAKLYKKKIPDIKKMIEDSTHFREDSAFIEDVTGQIVVLHSRIDSYEAAFAEFEKEAIEDDGKERSSAKNTPVSPTKKRSVDSLPLVGMNPSKEPPKPPSPEVIRTNHGPQTPDRRSRSKRRSRSPKRSRKSRSRSRSHSRSRRRRRSGSRDRSHSRERSRSRERKHRRGRSRSRDRKIRSRSRDHKLHRSRSPSPKRSPPHHRSQSPPHQRNHSAHRRSRSRSESPASFELRMRQYFEAEEEMTRQLEEERARYLAHSDLHPEYNEQWKRFYAHKSEYGQRRVQIEYINDEWVLVWKEFFTEWCERTLRERRNVLMNRFRVFRSDIKKFMELEQQRQRSKSRTRSPTMRRSSLSPFADRESRLSGGGTRNLDAAELATNPERRVETPVAIPEKSARPAGLTDNDVTVISTLRLLSALEDILDSLGPQINSFLGQANSMEVNGKFGDSMKLVHEQPFFRVLDAAREKLRQKISSNTIAERHDKVARICIDNISILMQQSTCEKEEILEISESKAPDAQEVEMKRMIAKTLFEEFQARGQLPKPEDFGRMVETEYQRVVKRMKEQEEEKNITAEAIASKWNAAAQPVLPNLDWNALQDALKQVNGGAAGIDARGGPSSGSRGDQRGPAGPSSGSRGDQGGPGGPVQRGPPGSRVGPPGSRGGPSRGEPSKEPVVIDLIDDEKSADNFDDLSIVELRSLFRNFQSLDSQSQKSFIDYMKKLEKTNPQKVRELKQHIHGKN